METGSERDSSHTGWLKRQTEAWLATGLISAEQAAAILSRYPSEDAPRRRIVIIVSLLAVVLIAAGILSFIAANWAGMEHSTRIALILVGMALFYGLGNWFRWRRDLPILGNSLLLLGGVTFGAGVWLIGQTYHLNPEDRQFAPRQRAGGPVGERVAWWAVAVHHRSRGQEWFLARDEDDIAAASARGRRGHSPRPYNFLVEPRRAVSFHSRNRRDGTLDDPN